MTGEKSQEAKLGRVLISEQDLRRRVSELGGQITQDYKGKRPLMIGVLTGAFVFMADLIRKIDLPVEMDFVAVSSYGIGTKSSGSIKTLKDTDADLHDRHVVLVEDIVDSGLTLSKLRENLLLRSPASLEIAAMLVRDQLDPKELGIKYVGFQIPDDFVVGYGLDAAQRYRNLPDVRSYNE